MACPIRTRFTFTKAMLNAQGEAPAEVLDQIDFPYPMILKPSDGIMWWQHEFEGQKKAYEIADRALSWNRSFAIRMPAATPTT